MMISINAKILPVSYTFQIVKLPLENFLTTFQSSKNHF